MRHCTLRATACLLTLIVVGDGTPAPAQTRLRIVAFNAEALAAPGERPRLERYRWDEARHRHFERVAAVIEALEPDIIGLEEVLSVHTIDYLVKLLHEKGLTAYKGYHIESMDTFTGFDVAFLSKLPPDEIDGAAIHRVWSPAGDTTWRARYPYLDLDGVMKERETSISRNAVYYFTVGRHKLGFLGLHLKSNPEDVYANAQRTAESEVARRIINAHLVGRGYTPIVLGDLNDYDPDVPDRDETRSTATPVIANLKDYDPHSPGPELVNAASRIPRQADRYSSHWDRNENGAADADDVLTMIDHILLHKSLAPYIRRAFIMHTTGLETSDHFPVVVDLELPP